MIPQSKVRGQTQPVTTPSSGTWSWISLIDISQVFILSARKGFASLDQAWAQIYGICLIRDAEAKKAPYFLASFLRKFLFLLSFFIASMWGIAKAFKSSQCCPSSHHSAAGPPWCPSRTWSEEWTSAWCSGETLSFWGSEVSRLTCTSPVYKNCAGLPTPSCTGCCEAVVVGHMKMKDDELAYNVLLVVNFLVSLLKKNWQNIQAL